MSQDDGNASLPSLQWLYTTQLFGIKMGLDNMRRLLDAMELPMRGQRFIHVAGTNGKGSTCAFAHSILKEAGIRAGLFTSPHLIRFSERIQDTERCISDDEIEAGLCRLRELVKEWDPHPTFFELTLALALDWFRFRKVDWVILETGLGGRLDATNVVRPEVSVITSIGWDHADVLGDSLGAIAFEKAGIIKPGVPVVTQPQAPEVRTVLERVASERSAKLTQVTALASASLGLKGPHQRLNASLAVEALRIAGVEVEEQNLEAGLKDLRWPARFQRVNGTPFIIDGAHNVAAAERLVETWREEYGDVRATVIFGAVAGKDVEGIIGTLGKIVSEWRFVGFRSPRALPPDELAHLWQRQKEEGPPPQVFGTIQEATDRLPEGIVLIAGSLYLAGEALALLENCPEHLEVSRQ